MRQIDDHKDTPRELFVVRTPEGRAVPGIQPVFELFPELEEWPTRDLYVQHPTKPDHWRCIGRNDDVIVLSNGEKLNPVDTESRVVNSHSKVTAALVIGHGRFAPGLLLEVRHVDVNDPLQRASLIDEIWPSVQIANKEVAGHGRLSKALITFTSPSKPFLRTPKLSVRRKPTIDLYAQEIQEMYDRFGQSSGGMEAQSNGTMKLDLISMAGIQNFVRESVASVTEWDHIPGEDEDLFMLGMDSLQALRIAQAMRAGLSRHGNSVEFHPRQVYKNPTINALSVELERVATKPTGVVLKEDIPPKREEMIESLISKYSIFDTGTQLKEEASTTQYDATNNNRPLHIILTGTTGSLGSNILFSLLKNPDIHHVYCLNRSKTAREQYLEFLSNSLLAPHGGVTDSFDQRASFFHTSSLGLPRLGLDENGHYEQLLQANVTHIIHNAWPVNFNLSLSSFTSHLAGIRGLVDFCLESGRTLRLTSAARYMPTLIFVSSLSSVTTLSSWTQVPETVISDPYAPAHTGYGESKYVAERILDEANQQIPNLRTTILRVGQIAGPVTHDATWPAREWLPSLIVSSKTIDALPSDLGKMNNVDWVPVDLLADSVSELLSSINEHNPALPRQGNSTVYHIFNHQVVPWQTLLPVVQKQTGISRTLSLNKWIELVEQQPNVEEGQTDTSESTKANPAKKIIQFYQSLDLQSVDISSSANASPDNGDPQTFATSLNGVQSTQRYELDRLRSVSATFRSLQPVSSGWMAKWIRGWL
jgi:thioester reductase-like protein/aryl carrier-like protein